MSLRHHVLRIANQRVMRKLARVANRVLRPPMPIPVKVDGCFVYAETLDRLLSLWMRKFSSAERYETQVWLSLLEPGMVVADVGANLGLYSLLASEAVGPEGVVHAFEPHPSNYRMLMRSIERNGCKNIVSHQAAVSDRSGSLDLFVSPEHYGDHRIYQPSNGAARPSVSVEVVKLDELLEEENRLDAVKLDIQGAEILAINGMSNLMDVNPNLRIISEFWPEGLEQSGTDPLRFLDEMRQRGFNVQNIDADAAKLQEMTNEALLELCRKTRYTNVLFSR